MTNLLLNTWHTLLDQLLVTDAVYPCVFEATVLTLTISFRNPSV